jgi:hypothetical protein
MRNPRLEDLIQPGDKVLLGSPWYRGARGRIASVDEGTIGVVFDCREDGAVIRVPIEDLVICREITRLSGGSEFYSGVYIERNGETVLLSNRERELARMRGDL